MAYYFKVIADKNVARKIDITKISKIKLEY